MPSTTVHARAAAGASRQIFKNGRTLTLVSTTPTGPVFNQTLTEVTTPITGVVTRYKSNELNGDLIRHTDFKILVDAAIPITSDMKIRDGATTYSIVGDPVVEPGMTKIIYKVHARI